VVRQCDSQAFLLFEILFIVVFGRKSHFLLVHFTFPSIQVFKKNVTWGGGAGGQKIAKKMSRIIRTI